MMSPVPNRASDRCAQSRRAAPFALLKKRLSTQGANRQPMKYARLSPVNAPRAAQATIRKIRGSADPAVATPKAMITVSLGSTGSTASRQGSTNAIR